MADHVPEEATKYKCPDSAPDLVRQGNSSKDLSDSSTVLQVVHKPGEEIRANHPRVEPFNTPDATPLKVVLPSPYFLPALVADEASTPES